MVSEKWPEVTHFYSYPICREAFKEPMPPTIALAWDPSMVNCPVCLKSTAFLANDGKTVKPPNLFDMLRCEPLERMIAAEDAAKTRH